MKVVLLSYELPPDTGFGGIGTYTWYQARALARLGHDVRVVAGALEPGITHGETDDGVRVTRVLDPGPLAGAVRGLAEDGLPWASNRLRTAAGAHRALRDLLERETADVVEYPECGADGLLVSTLSQVPTCVRLHSPARLIMESYGADGRDVEVTSFLEKVSIDQADVRTAPSSFLAAEAVARMGVAPPVHVIPNGIDLDLFDRSEGVDVSERYGLPASGAVTILFSSRLERRKGAHLLPEICAEILGRYPHVHVVLAGADDGGAVAGSILARLGDEGMYERVHPLGRVGLADVRALLAYADVYLLPTMWDNAPYSCIEAMAAGRAVLASDCGGMHELVAHERSGLLARTGDVGSFVEGLARLVEDPALRERLGSAARRRVEAEFTDVAVARQTVELWRRILPV